MNNQSSSQQSEPAPLYLSELNAGNKEGHGCFGIFFGTALWIVFLFFVFFPGVGPFGRNEGFMVLALLLPAIALSALKPTIWTVAPFAGFLNLFMCIALTKTLSTDASKLVFICVSLLWLLPLAIRFIVKKLAVSRKS